MNVSIFGAIREQVDLVALVGRLTKLKRVGKLSKGCCPLPEHDDSTPSFCVYQDQRAHCFGCGFHGDAVDLWAAMKGFQQGIEAALDLAREYGIKLPERSPEAEKRETEQREKEAKYEKQARACHQALADHPNVREWWQTRGFTEELQKQFSLGTDRVGKEGVMPFLRHGRTLGLIRRQLDREPKYLLPAAEEFPDGHKPLFIIQSATDFYLVVEGFVDALACAALGFSVIAIGGTGISAEQREELLKLKGTFYLLPDNDSAGAKAGPVWAKDLYPRALLCSTEYGEGNKDIGDLFKAQGEKAKALLEELKSRAFDALDLSISKAPEGSTRSRWKYARENVLPLLLKIEDEGEQRAATEDVADALKLKASELRKALKTEAGQKEEIKDEEKDDIPQPGTDRYDRAVSLLKTPNLLDLVAADMERLGHVGEQLAKRLAFACAISARMGRPIQPSTHAQSSAGKNYLWDTTLKFLPPEIVHSRSGLSAKALFRTEVDLKGAVLYIQEVAGSEDAEFTIRVMQSDGRLIYEATEKGADGRMRNVIHEVEGPAVIVQTTTKNHLHPENETRVFPIYLDESQEQTGRIIQAHLNDAEGKGLTKEERESILQVWRDAIRLLEPADVLIPYATRIEIPISRVRIRRDAPRLINVIRVIAWLHQHQREKDYQGRILATEADFYTALNLTADSLLRAWKALTPSEEKVLKAIKDLPEEKQKYGFLRKDIKLPDVSDRSKRDALKSLAENGHLACDGRKGPQGFTYTLASGDASETSLGIYLRPLPDSPQTYLNQEIISGERLPPDTTRSPINYIAGENGRNDLRPINSVDLQDLGAIGQSSGENDLEVIYIDRDELAARTAEIADMCGVSDAEAQRMALAELNTAKPERIFDDEGNEYFF